MAIYAIERAIALASAAVPWLAGPTAMNSIDALARAVRAMAAKVRPRVLKLVIYSSTITICGSAMRRLPST